MNTEDPHVLPIDHYILNQLKFTLARDAEVLSKLVSPANISH